MLFDFFWDAHRFCGTMFDVPGEATGVWWFLVPLRQGAMTFS
jgi:hypothetical protein